VRSVINNQISLTVGCNKHIGVRGLLFLIYVNDIQNCASDAKLKLFADNTNLFVFSKSFSETNTTSNNLFSDLNK